MIPERINIKSRVKKHPFLAINYPRVLGNIQSSKINACNFIITAEIKKILKIKTNIQTKKKEINQQKICKSAASILEAQPPRT